MQIEIVWADGMSEMRDAESAGRVLVQPRHIGRPGVVLLRVGWTSAGVPRYAEDSSCVATPRWGPQQTTPSSTPVI